ncbi:MULTISPECIES: NAD(P)/FAD-dependent oxidoreductase [Metallosphaera]|uniref:NAD(P)/FAD-dependent oxidoreductase n=1 Tax=Metallosphaera TaxID=41980 RepID=UPI001F053A9F|nr:NAD(P)/FAD-dependent oxidoreductase [Metallosphaera sedula]MCH1771295.1 NAD(P)/FAD-dependent oxidoreductase [Metallosphaera sedula]MCP6729685.1 NAD(P)/FAD-dependent oxidoreductase [Metallosphaera sedula]
MLRVAVIGGGVGGSLIGSLLHDAGHDVTLFDIKDKYFKPCGDIVPNVYRPPFPWRVEYEIKDFAFYLDGERVYDVSYRSPKWLTINKSEWINSMRAKLRQVVGNEKPKLDNYDVVLDSRGPYPMDREVVYTTRVIMKVENFNPEAILEFNTRLTGFYWIFPAGEGLLNVGAGFLEDKNSRKLLLEYLRERFTKYEILDIRGAPISIGKVAKKEGRIGEARGLVFPLSGEGIRPSAISAEIAFGALNKGKPLEQELRKGLSTIESRISIQSLLLNWYRSSNISMRRTMLRHFLKSEILIDAFLEDKLDFQGIKESMELIKSGGIST